MLRIVIATIMFGALYSSYATANEISASEAASRYSEQTSYSISRKGRAIGSHTLKINATGSNIDVAIDTDIVVRILKIPVFKFSYNSTEKWENDKLVSVSSTTQTDGKTETASLQNKDNVSQLSSNDSETTSDEFLDFATNHWHIGAVSQSKVFNTITGAKNNVTVKKIEGETIQINDKTLNVTQYQYTGDLEARSWYDDNQRWVKLVFSAEDGSEITYLIDNP